MLLPEAAAGLTGGLVGKYTSQGVDYGLEKLGVNENVAGGVSATVGGVAGGGAAVATGSLLSSIFSGAAAGSEEGGLAGGGVFSIEGIAIGGLIGGTLGLGSYLWSKFHG